MSQKEKLLMDIGIVDFTMVELELYLDTHPYDKKALEYFGHYRKIKAGLMKEFSLKYYPLTKEEANCEQEWTYGNAPLPWEGVCG